MIIIVKFVNPKSNDNGTGRICGVTSPSHIRINEVTISNVENNHV